MKLNIELVPGELSLALCRQIFESPIEIQLAENAYVEIDKSAATVAKVIEENRTVYGINTGFGLLASTAIPNEKLELLQKSLVVSHATGTGHLMDDNLVRLLMTIKLNSLAQGYSGIRREVIDLMMSMLNHEVYPCIPIKGSVGASGDLAPLAHMSLPLIGEGEVIYQGQIKKSTEVFEQLGLAPIVLGPKEGLALLNGTQASTALALKGLFLTENCFNAGLVAGALSVDACKGSATPFDARIHQVRGHQGQNEVAETLLALLDGSKILNSHHDCDKVQDPYSLRCQPQVMGASLDFLRYCANTLAIEVNAVSDNPLVFSDDGDILSGGNFHAEPVGIAADTLAISLCEVGSISERRIAIMVDKNMSGLPAFLVEDSGVNSGFMIAQVTAAALCSENKTYAHPSTVDNIPTSANQEDHVSMATFAARKLTDIGENVATILAVELLGAAQGVDFRKPLKTSEKLTEVHQAIREKAAFYDKDRYFAPDIEAIKAMVLAGDFNQYTQPLQMPSL
jgi:histidine ammonia-lyase